jgi:tripartite-type tricarboxylate transporter receptor subunit TctC
MLTRAATAVNLSAGEYHMRACPLLVALAITVGGTASAQTDPRFPAKSIRLILPFPAGGASDFTARTLAQRLGASWGQQVVVDNRPGATGVIGVQLAARSAPDGYTALIASSSTFATAPASTPGLPYDPVKDFTPVSLLVLSPNVMTVHPSLPAQSLKELIQLARAKPGQIAYASPGIATASHMAGVLLARGAAIDLLHVPYKGGSLAVNDVVAGQVQILFGSISTAQPLVRAGRLRALAVTSAKRVTLLPEVPTVAEAAPLPGYEVIQWFGLVLPAGASHAVVGKFHRELTPILAAGDARESLLKQGFEPAGSTPAAFAAHIKSELAKWTGVFRELGIRGEELR